MKRLARRVCVAAATAVLLAGCAHPAHHPSGGDRSGTGVADSAGAASSGAATPEGDKGGAPAALGRSVPVSLRIPAIGVDTSVMGLGLAADGTVQVPPIAADDVAGWYRHSPTPGEVGPSVILGHVTVGSYGDGVFRRLGKLHGGDRIEVRRQDGSTAAFSVSTVRTVAKADFPTEDVYGDVDGPELRLITCGGPHSGDGYLDNVIVYADLSS